MDSDITLENVTKTFRLTSTEVSSMKTRVPLSNNRLVALDNISFNVSKGEMLGIIGQNGSGKTTLLRIIAGIYRPDSGSVILKGRLAPLLHIGTGFHNELTAKENIVISGLLLGIPKDKIRQRVEEIIEFAELQPFTNMKLKHYSSGMRTRLAFSTSLQLDADILLVDEILSVGDISFREKSYNAFLSFKESGKTVVYTTHNLGVLSKICDRVLWLHHGKIMDIGKPHDVIQRYKAASGQ